MDTPTYYADISPIALEVKVKYNLTDTQTLLYNHICRGDFRLRNEDGHLFYSTECNGFGWSGSREWVKKQFQPLIKAGLVKFTSLHDCKDGKYTSWYFYCPQFDFNDLVDASCYSNTYKLAILKHYLKLEDGFDKKNKIYGDIEFIHNKKGYTFIYKDEKNIYYWDHKSEGKKGDSLSYVGIGVPCYNRVIYYDKFDDMIHNICSFLVHDGYELIQNIPNYTNKRRFTI